MRRALPYVLLVTLLVGLAAAAVVTVGRAGGPVMIGIWL